MSADTSTSLDIAGGQLEVVFGLLPIPFVLGLTLLQPLCFLHHCLY